MLKQFVMWLFGYNKIIVCKSANRLISLLAKNNVNIWKLENNKDAITFYILKKDMKVLDLYCNKTLTTYKIASSKGLYIIFNRLKKKLPFLIGLLVFISLSIYTNSYIWYIDIKGTNVYTKEQLLTEIKKSYVPIGTKKRNIDCNTLENNLRIKYDKIAWISCNISGTCLTINLNETLNNDIIYDEKTPSNIISNKDCIIENIVATSGKVCCKKGQEVKKGDILISGAVNICNEYDELIETNYVSAKGIIYGISKYNYYDSFDMTYLTKEMSTKNKSKKVKNKYYLKIGNKYILFKPDKIHSGNTTVKTLKIGKTYYLPINIYREDNTKYDYIENVYTKEKALEKANKKLQLYINSLRKKDVEILQNNVKIYFESGKCVAKGTIKVKELIGIPSKLEIIEEQGEE